MKAVSTTGTLFAPWYSLPLCFWPCCPSVRSDLLSKFIHLMPALPFGVVLWPPCTESCVRCPPGLLPLCLPQCESHCVAGTDLFTGFHHDTLGFLTIVLPYSSVMLSVPVCICRMNERRHKWGNEWTQWLRSILCSSHRNKVIQRIFFVS